MKKIGSLNSDSGFKKTYGRKDNIKRKSTDKVFKSIIESETLTLNAVQGIEKNEDGSEIEELLDDVHKKGDNLVHYHNKESIEEYKKAVRKFISYVINEAMRVESVEGAKFNRYKPASKQKRYTLISVIDDKLDKLAAGILMNQEKQLSLLAKVEEINGLLVNLIS